MRPERGSGHWNPKLRLLASSPHPSTRMNRISLNGSEIITGGSIARETPPEPEELLATVAVKTQSIVATVRMVPNQPLVFADDGTPRTEDAIIAYSFDKYLTTGDDTWPALLPMTKSAVRAMDTVQDFMTKQIGGGVTINGFVVSGGSKRGWTTWLTRAVDPRVKAIAPIVIDVLNMDVQMEHQHAAYGFYAPAVQDYVDMDIFPRMDTPQGQALLAIVDPYSYTNRMTIPKYLINSTGDQFFLPDSAQFYLEDLPDETYLRYVPNSSHSLEGTDAGESLMAFYHSVLADRPRPRFSWSVAADNALRVVTQDPPIEVNLWQATVTGARDFRLDVAGPIWEKQTLSASGNGVYVAQVPPQEEGWTGYFIELVYPSGIEDVPFKLTTPVRIVPDTLPFADK